MRLSWGRRQKAPETPFVLKTKKQFWGRRHLIAKIVVKEKRHKRRVPIPAQGAAAASLQRATLGVFQIVAEFDLHCSVRI
jgi:hypothetical protein